MAGRLMAKKIVNGVWLMGQIDIMVIFDGVSCMF